MKSLLFYGAASIAVLSSSAANAQTRNFNIPAEDAVKAIPEFARQAGVQIVSSADQLGGVRTAAINGSMDVRTALHQMLGGTRIAIAADDGQTIVLKSAPKNVQAAPESGAATAAASYETVVVTAEKKAEALQNVPVPVTALSGADLVANNQLRIQDYFNKVPGLNLEVDATTGSPTISIRGVTTGGHTNPSVGVTIDDVAYGASTYIGGGFVSPDIDPSDLARVEVLRGPQGTLYGVASIGGLLKYVTVDPSTDGFSGYLRGGLSGVYNGESVGHNVAGGINEPLADNLAVRVSGYTHFDPGYIDNILTGQHGVNGRTTNGGMASTLWRPLDNVSVKLSALYQDTAASGASTVNTGAGFSDLQQSAIIGTGGNHAKFQALNGTINASLGSIDLTSVTGYGVNTESLSYDVTPTYGAFNNKTFGVGGAALFNNLGTKKFSQELRLSTKFGSNIDLMVGGFFTHENSLYVTQVLAEDTSSGQYKGQSLYFMNPTRYTEYAVFADLTYHFTDAFEVQVGGRQAWITQHTSSLTTGALVGGVTSTVPDSSADNSAFTYLITPKYQISPDLMVYARFASGYRAGGPNANAAFLKIPLQYGPDTTNNYDLGVKGDILNGAISIDASVYYIDWSNVQVNVRAPAPNNAAYITNGAAATSNGFELSAQSHPIEGMTVAGWFAWNRAILSGALPTGSSAFGISGNRLPFSAQTSGNFSIDQVFPIRDGMSWSIGGDVSYVGSVVGLFQSTATRQTYPAYGKLDLRAGLTYDAWNLDFYAHNLTDERAALVGGLDAATNFAASNSFVYIQPRTIGAVLSVKF